MKTLTLLVAISLLTLTLPAAAHGREVAAPSLVGTVIFPTSCDSKVQATFERAVAMLHSFWFSEASKTFKAVAEQDPQCAMAYWGLAYWGLAVNLLGNTLSASPPLKDLVAASAAVAKARAIGAPTPRERDWIEAIAAYYQDYDTTPLNKRQVAYTRALEQMTQRYPDDFEVWTYYALALQASAPANDKSYLNQRKAAEILERLFAKTPDHPGAAHYLIHAYDYPALADKGIGAAGKYAKIAPAAPHARHMPSHIYSMVGMWADSIASNRSALEVQPDYYHAMDFMVYAYLQLGQDAKARAMVDEMRDVFSKRGLGAAGFTALAAIPARCALERGDWKAAAELPVTTIGFGQADALTRFARGLGMARSGDVAGARAEIEALKALKQGLEKANQPYWVERTDEQIYAVSAWIARADGDRDRAETLMRAAAEGEDASVKSVQMENRLYPLRELYAELLMENGKPREALTHFEAALRENPKRYRSLYGVAVAAKAADQKATAAQHFESLLALAKDADNLRPELAQAKAFLANR